MALAVPSSDAAPSSAQVLTPSQKAPPSTPEVLFSEHEALATSIANQFFAIYRTPTLERDDLLQEARIGLYQAAERYDSTRGPFEPFARRTITGALQHARRADREAGEPSLTSSLTPFESEALVEPSHDQVSEARVLLDQLLAGLDERERQAVEMFHLQGHTKATIAHELGISERHAARVIDEAMKRLQVLAVDAT